MKKQIDIVVPCYNEEGNIKRLHQEIDNIFREQLPHATIRLFHYFRE